MNIIPAPRKLAPRKGVFHFASETSMRVQADPGSSLAHHASLLCSDIEKATGIVCRWNPPKRPSLSRQIIILSAPGHKAQGYALDIKSESITLEAGDVSGLIHGIQTLRQQIGRASCRERV